MAEGLALVDVEALVAKNVGVTCDSDSGVSGLIPRPHLRIHGQSDGRALKLEEHTLRDVMIQTLILFMVSLFKLYIHACTDLDTSRIKGLFQCHQILPCTMIGGWE